MVGGEGIDTDELKPVILLAALELWHAKEAKIKVEVGVLWKVFVIYNVEEVAFITRSIQNQEGFYSRKMRQMWCNDTNVSLYTNSWSDWLVTRVTEETGSWTSPDSWLRELWPAGPHLTSCGCIINGPPFFEKFFLRPKELLVRELLFISSLTYSAFFQHITVQYLVISYNTYTHWQFVSQCKHL